MTSANINLLSSLHNTVKYDFPGKNISSYWKNATSHGSRVNNKCFWFIYVFFYFATKYEKLILNF